jgi:hypothetical protein
MSTIAELRAYVRRQTETTSSELADTTIDPYLQEAFNRTIAAENDWPFYETTWTVVQTAGESTATKPSDARDVISLVDTANNNFRLTMLDYETAEDDYRGVSVGRSSASEYSLWGSTIYFWPAVTFDTDRSYRMRGYRAPTDWLAGPSTTEPDCDSRLHLPLAHYAVALAYAKQEDETLERTYMERWQKDVEMARQAIMSPEHQLPLMMGPRRWRKIGRGRYRFNYSIESP